ncbi:MAG TPA: hypothetical protein VGI12_06610 [Vicinamibacterales bacterium]|jgi:hypothetical protein
MTIRRCTTSVLIGTLISALAPANSWAADSTSANPPKAFSLQVAIHQAAAAAVATPNLRLQVKAPAPAKASGVRRQSNGGGHAGMIIGLVTAVAGIGATLYMVKEMEKETKNIPVPTPQ